MNVPVGTVIAGRYQVTEALPWRRAVLTLRARRVDGHGHVGVSILPRQTFGDLGGEVETHAATASRVQHASLMPLVEYGRMPDQAPFFVFEARPGKTLSEHLFETGPLSAAQVIDLGCQVLAVLEQAHAMGISHGNLQPDCILLEEVRADGVRALVSELPCPPPPARVGEQTHKTDLAYTAPEVIHGAEPGPAADCYALGLILAEALTGSPVVSEATAAAMAQAQGSERPITLPAAALKSPLAPALLGAVRKAPTRRTTDAALLRKSLEASRPRPSGGGKSTRAFNPALDETEFGPQGLISPEVEAAAQARAAQGAQAAQGAYAPPGHAAPAHGYAAAPQGQGYAAPGYAAPGYAAPGHPPQGHGGQGYEGAPMTARPSMLGAPSRVRVAPKKRGGGLFVFAILGVLVLGGGGVAAFMLTREDTKASSDDDDGKKKKKKKKKKSEDDGSDIDPKLLDGPQGSLEGTREIRKRALEDGWTIVRDLLSPQGGVKNQIIQLKKDAAFATVHVSIFPSENTAQSVAQSHQRNFTAVSRDGATVITVRGNQGQQQGQALLNLLTK